MPGFAEDPQLLTKEKLKRELVAHKVALPAGEHKKEVYVRLYHRLVAPTSGADFSSDEEDDGGAAPSLHGADGGVSSSDGVGTTSDMTSKVEVGGLDVDVSSLSNAELARKIREFGVSPGPIVATTRKLYEKKLLRLLEHGDAAPSTAAAGSSGVNGSLQTDNYSDTEEDEEEETAEVYEQTGEVTEKAIQTSFQSPFTAHSTKAHASPGPSQDSPAGRPGPVSLHRQAIAHQRALAVSGADADITKESTPCTMRQWSFQSTGPDDNVDFSPDVEMFTNSASRRETQREKVAIATPMGRSSEDIAATQERRQKRATPCTLKGQGRQSKNIADLKLGGGNDADLFISPSGISATRRRPIRGCARDGWGGFSPDLASRSSNDLGASPISRPPGQGSVHKAAASGPAAAAASVPVWARLVAFVVACAFIALVYYAFEENVHFSGSFDGAADAATAAAAVGGNDGGGVAMAE
ncbi:lamina-associated polypeptide 2-like isoform X6 [Lethenteron reissneri]|uniref:lamina-associated polypeptide 2-like isoform X6 n=1 Tax=Lethenteron reissneri TaxID=7753 RepID=UPI002AB66D0B|nr:lamina-associated polypeptide 2-like isoform X6 [Lethenteron reissneri]